MNQLELKSHLPLMTHVVSEEFREKSDGESNKRAGSRKAEFLPGDEAFVQSCPLTRSKLKRRR